MSVSLDKRLKIDDRRIAVLLSGQGSTLQAIIDAIQSKTLHAQICIVVSDQADAYGLSRAKAAGLKTLTLEKQPGEKRAAYDQRLRTALAHHHINLIVLAGFMRILSSVFVDTYAGRLINIHPSLLPKFPGLDTHARAIEAGETAHGTSVHFVDQSLDGGPLIAQAHCPILETDTPDTLKERVQKLEHTLYPQVIETLLNSKTQP